MASPKGRVPPQFLPGYKKKGATLPPVSGSPSTRAPKAGAFAPIEKTEKEPMMKKQKSLFKKHPVGGYNM